MGPGRETERSFPFSAEVKNGWSCASAFMLWAGNIYLFCNSTNNLMVTVGRSLKQHKQSDGYCRTFTKTAQTV